MDIKWYFRLVIFILVAKFQNGVESCWGRNSNNYGVATSDYSMMVGSTLEVNCTLLVNSITINNKQYEVNSSQIIFKASVNGQLIRLKDVYIINSTTAQLRIPNANESNDGVYYCHVSIPSEETLICPTQIRVGYPPFPVENFNCISRNFRILNCTWDSPPNKVLTTYSLYLKRFGDKIQMCPLTTVPNSCEWRNDTSPLYPQSLREFRFILNGTNALGSESQHFTVNHFEIVKPDKPADLRAICEKRELTVYWLPPNGMQKIELLETPPLFYQLQYRVKSNANDWVVIDVGIDILNYTVEDLIPYTNYEIRLRCHSNATTKENMWSTFTTITNRTLSDVPYIVPEIIPEAFRNQYFQNSRSITLYWKQVPVEYQNGGNFKYIVHYINQDTDEMLQVNVTSPTAVIQSLNSNATYVFKIFSANEVGISENYSAIVVKNSEKLLKPVTSISVVFLGHGQYRLNWDKSTSEDVIKYTVFWCENRNPLVFQCKGPIYWSKSNDTNMVVNASGSSAFIFAVAATSLDSSSGMEWTECVVPYVGALGKITEVSLEAKNSTSMKVTWKLKCRSQSVIVKKFQIAYCKSPDQKLCSDKEILDVTNPRAESVIIGGLSPATKYKVVLRSYTNNNQVSEDSEPKYVKTFLGAPDPPDNIVVTEVTNTTIFLSWAPPLQYSGKISHYIVYYNTQSQIFNASDDFSECSGELKNLQSYTYYTIQLQACVQDHCSLPSDVLEQRTEIGVPGMVNSLRFEGINSTVVNISWNPPTLPNGPLDYYILYVEQSNKGSNISNIEHYRIDGSLNFKSYEVRCPSDEKSLLLSFRIQAVNKKVYENLYGPVSNPINNNMCFMSMGPAVSMFVGFAVGGTIGLAILVFVLYLLFTWMKKKIDLIKAIKVQLPCGLDNPPNKISGDAHTSPRTIHGRADSFTNDIDYKNRHGSGSSQHSTTSTDELIYKTNRCTQFGRNPSGDSSGCSSGGHDSISSSNTTRTQLSVDSGTEADIVLSLLPKVSEVQDSESKPNGEALNNSKAKEEKFENNKSLGTQNSKTITAKEHSHLSGIVLGVKPTYNNSKLSPSDAAAPFLKWDGRPLIFYSRNLAVSEPSFLDANLPANSNEETAVSLAAPYSKFGLAKSVENVDSVGYSKFAMVNNMFGDQWSLNHDGVLQRNMDDKSKIYHLPIGKTCHLPRQGYVTVGAAMEQPKTIPFHMQKSEIPVCPKSKQISSCDSDTHGYVLYGETAGTKNEEVVDKSGCTDMYSRFGLTMSPPQSKGYISLDHIKNMSNDSGGINPSTENESTDFSLLHMPDASRENKNLLSADMLSPDNCNTAEGGSLELPLLPYNTSRLYSIDKNVHSSVSAGSSLTNYENESDENHNHLLNTPGNPYPALPSFQDTDLVGTRQNVSPVPLVDSIRDVLRDSSHSLDKHNTVRCDNLDQVCKNTLDLNSGHLLCTKNKLLEDNCDNLADHNTPSLLPQPIPGVQQGAKQCIHSTSTCTSPLQNLPQSDSLEKLKPLQTQLRDDKIDKTLYPVQSVANEHHLPLHEKRNGYISHNALSVLLGDSIGKGTSNHLNKSASCMPENGPCDCSSTSSISSSSASSVNNSVAPSIPVIHTNPEVPHIKSANMAYVPQHKVAPLGCKVAEGFSENGGSGYIPFVKPMNILDCSTQPESQGFVVTLVPEPDTEVCEV